MFEWLDQILFIMSHLNLPEDESKIIFLHINIYYYTTLVFKTDLHLKDLP